MSLLTPEQVSAVDKAFFNSLAQAGLRLGVLGLFSIGEVINQSGGATPALPDILENVGGALGSNAVTLLASGADTNIGINITPQGTGNTAITSGNLSLSATSPSLSIGTETLARGPGGGGQLTLTTGGGGWFFSAGPVTISNGQALYFNASQTDSLIQSGGIHTLTSNVASAAASSGVLNINTSNTLAGASDLLLKLANNSVQQFAVDKSGVLKIGSNETISETGGNTLSIVGGNGGISLGGNGAIFPSIDNNFNLGAPSFRWATVYALNVQVSSNLKTVNGVVQATGGTPLLVEGNSGAAGPGVDIGNSAALTSGFAMRVFKDAEVTPVLNVQWNGLENLYGTAPRRWGSMNTVTNADTAFTIAAGQVDALPNPQLLAGTPTADTTDSSQLSFIKFTTGTVSGNASGQSGPFSTVAATTFPLLYAVVRTDPAAVTSVRYYVGMGASSLDQVATLAGANGVKGAWFRFDTGIGDTDWMCETSDGTTASATDSTVAVAAATTYILLIDNSVSGACDFYVNGVLKVHKTTNINTSSTILGIETSVTTLTTAARALSVSKVALQQN